MRVLDVSHNKQDLAANFFTDVSEFPWEPACFEGRPLPIGAILAPLMTFRYIAETAHSSLAEVPSATGGRSDVMSKKTALVYHVGNMEYRFAVSKYLLDELFVNLCVLQRRRRRTDRVLPGRDVLA